MKFLLLIALLACSAEGNSHSSQDNEGTCESKQDGSCPAALDSQDDDALSLLQTQAKLKVNVEDEAGNDEAQKNKKLFRRATTKSKADVDGIKKGIADLKKTSGPLKLKFEICTLVVRSTSEIPPPYTYETNLKKFLTFLNMTKGTQDPRKVESNMAHLHGRLVNAEILDDPETFSFFVVEEGLEDERVSLLAAKLNESLSLMQEARDAVDHPMANMGGNPFSNGRDTLHMCEGDCDYDYQCKGTHMKCYQRGSGEKNDQDKIVPGCSSPDGVSTSTTANNVRGWDYCYDERYLNNRGENGPFSGTTSSLGLCEGDCDDNDDCGYIMVPHSSGRPVRQNLECFKRDDISEKVPGCFGGGEHDVSSYDYCINPDAPDVMTDYGWTPAGSGRRIKACAGDCDDDDDCFSGLECFKRPDKRQVPGCTKGHDGDVSDMDYCYDPENPVVAPGKQYADYMEGMTFEAACNERAHTIGVGVGGQTFGLTFGHSQELGYGFDRTATGQSNHVYAKMATFKSECKGITIGTAPEVADLGMTFTKGYYDDFGKIAGVSRAHGGAIGAGLTWERNNVKCCAPGVNGFPSFTRFEDGFGGYVSNFATLAEEIVEEWVDECTNCGLFYGVGIGFGSLPVGDIDFIAEGCTTDAISEAVEYLVDCDEWTTTRENYDWDAILAGDPDTPTPWGDVVSLWDDHVITPVVRSTEGSGVNPGTVVEEGGHFFDFMMSNNNR